MALAPHGEGSQGLGVILVSAKKTTKLTRFFVLYYKLIANTYVAWQYTERMDLQCNPWYICMTQCDLLRDIPH